MTPKSREEIARQCVLDQAVRVKLMTLATTLYSIQPPSDHKTRDSAMANAIVLGDETERLRVMQVQHAALIGKKSHAGAKRGGRNKAYSEEMLNDLDRICQAAVEAEIATDPNINYTTAVKRAARKLRYPNNAYADGRTFPNAGQPINPKTVERHSQRPNKDTPGHLS
jgi:hypothetical protein